MKRSIGSSKQSRPRAVGLLSGGLDSTVSLVLAMRRVDVVCAVTFRYGQRADREEVKAARRIARVLAVPHRVISLPWLARLDAGALVGSATRVPALRTSDLDSARGKEAARAVWVPNRNGLFVNAAACLAEAWDAQIVVGGFNREEAAAFPDNGPEFVRAVNRSLQWSTLNGVRVISYVQGMTKREMVEAGSAVGAPLDAVYSCYAGGIAHCGCCESCQRLKRAFRAAGRWPVIRSRFET